MSFGSIEMPNFPGHENSLRGRSKRSIRSRRGKQRMGLLLLLSLGCACDLVTASGADLRNFCVRSGPSISITDSDADAVFTAATTVLQKTGDNSCNAVQLIRQGGVKSYGATDYPLALTGRSDFEKFTKDACIKLVDFITWCGDQTILPEGGALGCAPISGKGIVAVRVYPDSAVTAEEDKAMEPLTWLHEYGHNLGLEHSQDAFDVMTPNIQPSSDRVSTGECKTFGSVVPANPKPGTAGTAAGGVPATSLVRALPAQASGSSPANGETELPLVEFVKREARGSTWLAHAQTYSGQVAEVEAMLTDTKFDSYRNKIIALLGVIGTPQTIPLLQRVIETPLNPRPSRVDQLARFAAPLAIGSIASRYKLPETDFHFLRDASHTSYWETRVFKGDWEEPSPESLPANGAPPPENVPAATPLQLSTLSKVLATQAARGYALSGNSQARNNLIQDTQASMAAVPATAKKQQQDDLKGLLLLNKKSAEQGALAAYQ
jgi:hypothetical protein